MFLDQRRFSDDPSQSAQWNRGAYLVRALGHCGECHTPRNVFGALQTEQALAGNSEGPDGEPVPNITPHSNGLAGWSESDITQYLKNGMDPDFDFAGGAMAEVVDDGTGYLSDDDLKAIAIYLKSLPATQ